MWSPRGSVWLTRVAPCRLFLPPIVILSTMWLFKVTHEAQMITQLKPKSSKVTQMKTVCQRMDKDKHKLPHERRRSAGKTGCLWITEWLTKGLSLPGYTQLTCAALSFIFFLCLHCFSLLLCWLCGSKCCGLWGSGTSRAHRLGGSSLEWSANRHLTAHLRHSMRTNAGKEAASSSPDKTAKLKCARLWQTNKETQSNHYIYIKPRLPLCGHVPSVSVFISLDSCWAIFPTLDATLQHINTSIPFTNI